MLKYIIVIAGIKVTLTPVINWTGQLQHTWSVKSEEVCKQILMMFQDVGSACRQKDESACIPFSLVISSFNHPVKGKVQTKFIM